MSRFDRFHYGCLAKRRIYDVPTGTPPAMRVNYAQNGKLCLIGVAIIPLEFQTV